MICADDDLNANRCAELSPVGVIDSAPAQFNAERNRRDPQLKTQKPDDRRSL